MKTSKKGKRNEYKSRDWLKAKGYRHVIRAAGSFGEWDLVALDPRLPVMLVQVKSNRKPTKLDPSTIQDYSPEWLLRYHVWKDWSRDPDVYDATTGDRAGSFCRAT